MLHEIYIDRRGGLSVLETYSTADYEGTIKIIYQLLNESTGEFVGIGNIFVRREDIDTVTIIKGTDND